MLFSPAQYLLRLDDLCPTVPAGRWGRFVPLIEQFRLHPILAVIPDNRDPELQIAAPDPTFWSSMRGLEAAGAAIALHGYRHHCSSRGASLLGLSRQSEFAGIPEATQRQWIREGMGILRAHGLTPRMWVAPRHGFDAPTLRALQAEGILVLSDGLARQPFMRDGLLWIPQQLWAPQEKRRGLWTICIHPHTARMEEVEALHAFLRTHAAQFTSIDRILSEFHPEPLGMRESAYARLALWRVKTRGIRNRFRLSRSSLRNTGG